MRHAHAATGWVLFALLWPAPGIAIGQAPIDIAQYCGPALADHTECIAAWVGAGRATPARVLYASKGEYRYRSPATIYSGMQVKCAGPDATLFRNIGGGGEAFAAVARVDNVLIADCGFDVNGNPTNFLAVVDVSPDNDPAPSTGIRIRGNRFFDSRGTPPPLATNQRQYVLLLNCRDCVVEGNQLHNGGRIRVGRPGTSVRIRNNFVEDANDNAITVSDRDNQRSRDIHISGNRILNPVGVGIYFGADSDRDRWPLMALEDVRISGNRVEGSWKLACILGRLPYDSQKVRIESNECVRTSPSAANSQTVGIQIRRTCEADRPAREVTLRRNILATTVQTGTALDLAGISFIGTHSNVRVRFNEIRNIGSRAMLFRFVKIEQARITGNVILGGVIRVEGSVSGQLQPHEEGPAAGPAVAPCG